MSNNLAEKVRDNIDSNERARVSAASIMDEIRAQIKRDLSSGTIKRPEHTPKKLDSSENVRGGQLMLSEDLLYLNRHSTFPLLEYNLSAIHSHRRGVGKFVVWLRRKIAAFVWKRILRDYFDSERRFHLSLVKFLNANAEYIDKRDAAIFWDLIHKIDVDVTQKIDRIQDQLGAEINSQVRSLHEDIKILNDRLSELSARTVQDEAQIKTIDNALKGVEGIVARINNAPVNNAAGAAPSSDQEAVRPSGADYSYLLLENRFRGGEDEISERLRIYPELFKAASAPVLEIGAGRGELQKLFKQAGIKSYGIDINPAMVERCSSQGLEVKLADLVSHLQTLPERSLGGIIAVQVVEHLPIAVLKRFLELASSRLKQGAKIVCETINSASLLALAHNYFRDPTHVFPLHPDTLRYTVELAGFKVLEIRALSAYDKQAQLKEIDLDQFMTPRWGELVSSLNHNIRQLNDIMYGHQDYCIIAEAR